MLQDMKFFRGATEVTTQPAVHGAKYATIRTSIFIDTASLFDSLVLVAVYLAPQLVEFFTALPNSGEGLC